MELEQRILALEAWRNTVDVTLGKHEVDRTYINKQFEDIRNELKEIKSASKTLTWTVWAAVIVAFVKFALGGGLALAPIAIN